jgi:hypothetical protein
MMKESHGSSDTDAPVKVLTDGRASVVAVDNSVWVQHWNNLEHDATTELNSRRGFTEKKFKQSFHHI